MQTPSSGPVLVVDRYTRCCLTAIAVLLTVLIGFLLASGPVPWASPAAAQSADGSAPPLPNPAADRNALLKAAEETNKKLDRIISLMESGKIKVIVETPAAKANVNAEPRPAKD